MDGKFIVFEGIDGCGKGTQLNKAAAFLYSNTKKYDILRTREPTKDFKEIRERLAQLKDSKTDFAWFTDAFIKDRINHVKECIQPMLKKGTIVLCDRYKYSTLAYQQTQGADLNELKKRHEGILVPDLILLFDCPAEIAFNRRKNDNPTDCFDKDLEFQKKLRENYLALKNDLSEENIVIINANKPIEEIFEDVKKEINKMF